MSEWNLEKFADHYVKTITQPPVRGVYVCPIYGDSQRLMLIASLKFGVNETTIAFGRAIKKYESQNDTPK